MSVTQQTVDLVKKFEGFRSKAYRCPAGVWTIGYGTTSGVSKGQQVTQGEAELMLSTDLAVAINAVRNAVKVKLNDNQLSALASFVYNVGEGAFKGSTLLKKLNAGDYGAVPSELRKWTHAGGRMLVGLAVRRDAEAKLWNKA